MPKCSNISKKIKRPCVGDMDTLIKLHNREIVGPTNGVDFNESFDERDIVWSLHQVIESGNVTVFDDTNIEVVLTDKFYIYYDETVTSETWVELDGKYYDIIGSPIDISNNKEFMLLNCTVRGDKSKRVNLA